jgi:hypothetical protein
LEVAGTTVRVLLLLGLRSEEKEEEEEEEASSSRRLAFAVVRVNKGTRNEEQGIRDKVGETKSKEYLSGGLTPLVLLVPRWSHYVGNREASG